MDRFSSLHIYLDAVKYTAVVMITPGFTQTLSSRVLIDTLLVTRDGVPVTYSVRGKKGEAQELEHIPENTTVPAVITFFSKGIKWSGDHKFLIRTEAPHASMSQFDIEIENSGDQEVKADTIFLVNQAFQEHPQHNYRMKGYEEAAMVPMARGPTESGSNLLVTSARVFPTTLKNIHIGMTRFSVDGMLKFIRGSFKFPVGRPASQIPAEFDVTVQATGDAPAGNVIMYSVGDKTYPFLGQSTVAPFTADQKRDIPVSISPTLLADVTIEEVPKAHSKTVSTKIVTITITVTNYDPLARYAVFMLPVNSRIRTNTFEPSSGWEIVDGNYEWYSLCPGRADSGAEPRRTQRVISYDHWTELHHPL
jgi:hypothetical protein